MKRLPLAALVFVWAGTPVLAQSVDPHRRQPIEQQIEAAQKQQLDFQEWLYDNQFCLTTNYARSDFERCVSDWEISAVPTARLV
jgi:hypothetical protein